MTLHGKSFTVLWNLALRRQQRWVTSRRTSANVWRQSAVFKSTFLCSMAPICRVASHVPESAERLPSPAEGRGICSVRVVQDKRTLSVELCVRRWPGVLLPRRAFAFFFKIARSIDVLYVTLPSRTTTRRKSDVDRMSERHSPRKYRQMDKGLTTW